MPSFNKVMMIGNLTRDPQVKNLPSGVVLGRVRAGDEPQVPDRVG